MFVIEMTNDLFRHVHFLILLLSSQRANTEWEIYVCAFTWRCSSSFSFLGKLMLVWKIWVSHLCIRTNERKKIISEKRNCKCRRMVGEIKGFFLSVSFSLSWKHECAHLRKWNYSFTLALSYYIVIPSAFHLRTGTKFETFLSGVYLFFSLAKSFFVKNEHRN